jgi:hypothetical protein
MGKKCVTENLIELVAAQAKAFGSLARFKDACKALIEKEKQKPKRKRTRKATRDCGKKSHGKQIKRNKFERVCACHG